MADADLLDVHSTVTRAELGALLDAAAAARGHKPLDDRRRDAVLGADAHAPTVLGTRLDGDLAGVAIVDGNARTGWSVELVTDPRNDASPGTVEALLFAALDTIAVRGGGRTHWWRYRIERDPDTTHDQLASNAGLTIRRDLWQMRVALPIDRSGGLLATRPFAPADADDWLAVNNRAFAGHPEQSAWTADDLERRLVEPWFDPSGFLIHEVDGRIAGFCWTKRHVEHDPELGEIYVIAVDPDFHGRGLGRSLVEAGLERLRDQGLTVGMLYVDADNAAAVRLYESMGFTRHHTDRAHVGVIEAG